MDAPFIYDILFLAFISLIDYVQSVDGFYGSPLVLDGYCENREQYLLALTLPVDIAHVEGSPDNIHNKLVELNSTGKGKFLYCFYISFL